MRAIIGVQVPIPTATTPTNVTLQYSCSCGNNVTVWVRRSQRCNILSLFLTLSLTISQTLYVGIGSVGIALVGQGTAPTIVRACVCV